MSKTSILLGVGGDFQHGKTSLVRQLAGVNTDSLPEEKEQGRSIVSGIAPLKLPSGRHLAVMDVPGHPDLINRTIRGLSLTDMAILVVAADDGVSEQSKNHLDILQLFECKTGVVALSKIDLIEHEIQELVQEEIRELTTGSFLESAEVIPFSIHDPACRELLVKALETATKKVVGKDPSGPFRMHIDHIYSPEKGGTVVAGTIVSGSISQGACVEVFPAGHSAKAISIQVHRKTTDIARAGQRVGIQLTPLEPKAVESGMVLADRGLLDTSYCISGNFQYASSNSRPLQSRSPVRVHTGTAATNAFMVILDSETLQPGDSALIQLRLLDQLVPMTTDRFVITSLDHHAVIGGGSVLDTRENRSRRGLAKTAAYLKALQDQDVSKAVTDLLAEETIKPLLLQDMVHKTGLPEQSVRQTVIEMTAQGHVMNFGQSAYFSSRHYLHLKKRALEILERVYALNPQPTPMPKEKIRKRLDPALAPEIFEAILRQLLEEGKVTADVDSIAPIDSTATLTGTQRRIIANILDHANKAGFAPVSANSVWKIHRQGFGTEDIQDMLDFLCFRKDLVRLYDSRLLASKRARDSRFLASNKLDQIQNKLFRYAARHATFTLPEVKSLLGVSRTSAVRILEHLDAVGFTMRSGNARMIRKEVLRFQSLDRQWHVPLKSAKEPRQEITQPASRTHGI